MLTVQDLLAVPQSDKARAEFVRTVIEEHKRSDLYKTAVVGDEYDRNQNTTITNYQKLLQSAAGELVPDTWSPNHKAASGFFSVMTTQLTQYLLANGVKWNKEDTKKALGMNFDTRLQQTAHAALVGGVSFGLWNMDHLDVFKVYDGVNKSTFAPLYDEETGALGAGVRSWQLDKTRPLRGTLYEPDGYTNFLWETGSKTPMSGAWKSVDSGIYMTDKTPYIVKTLTTKADGVVIVDGENYQNFPIIPLWGNSQHQSEIVGLREKIDAYDLILNGYANELDSAQILWVIKGAAGLSGDDNADLVKFLNELRRFGGVATGDDQEITPVALNIPHEARADLLDRLEAQMYKDAMILNPAEIAGGSATATQIRAAYEPQNVKTDQFEYCVIDFLNGILNVAGLEDEPTFTRSMIVNTQEEIQTLVTAGSYLSGEYVTGKILSLLGDGDKTSEVLAQIDGEDMDRLSGTDM